MVFHADILTFADDTKCLKRLLNREDQLDLQDDLVSLYLWSKSNIPFNLDKFTCMRFVDRSCQYQSSLSAYKLDEFELPFSSTHKDLGLYLSDDLSWSHHYAKIVAKAYKTLGLLRRIFKSSSVQAKRRLYVILIRSQLTYGSQLWRPYLVKDIRLIFEIHTKSISFF